MRAWRVAFVVVCLSVSLAAVVQRASADSSADVKPKNDVKGPSSVRQRRDLYGTTTRRPATTRAPAKPAGLDFDLADALEDTDDKQKKPSMGAGEGAFSDKDLEDILGDNYKPDKGKGDGRSSSEDSPESGMPAETGTIAGVASALAMALVGAISSYISYQQKKFCFSIQHAAEGSEGVNADYVKGEHMEAVVCEEPQVKFSEVQASAPPQPRI
ncbi:CD99 antigen-like protein 2 isoform X1 [Sorex araneus]|uniref:CD99 antigen-like protein 2 isoform X1 n=1 Tax=Sorex araneus TaxID=42254 RepID=UPI002433A3A3|nr:CD99 antigen-like protein 2 isoform X1 [Sorex araneus]